MSSVSYRDVLRHRASGLSLQKTADACGCARSTVQDIVQLAKKRDVGWKDVEDLTDAEAYELVRGKPEQVELYAPIDYKKIYDEMTRDRTMKMTILWEEYVIEAVESDKRPYQYSRFCEKYHVWCDANDIAVIKRYIAADIGEFDWAGKKLTICNPDAGELADVPVFVACLPYSQYVFVRAYSDMTMESWLQAAADSFAFFGGCPRIVVIDNLRTGVTKHTSEEIVLNRTFREFAEHYNVAVIPHAPRRPRGKNSVESSVDKFANKIRLELRKQRFFDIDELNEAVAAKAAELNAKPFQKRASSRAEVFLEREKPCLQPLPERPWERAIWSPKVKVGKNYHVLCAADKVLYSVPHRFVGKEVEVRTTPHAVEVYCEGERIAIHARQRTHMPEDGPITNPEHRAKHHADYLDHDSEWYRHEAAKTGPATTKVIEGFLSEGLAEEQGWGWCEKLLKQRASHSSAAIESACEKALSILANPSYKAISTLIKNTAKSTELDDPAGGNPWAIRRY